MCGGSHGSLPHFPNQASVEKKKTNTLTLKEFMSSQSDLFPSERKKGKCLHCLVIQDIWSIAGLVVHNEAIQS